MIMEHNAGYLPQKFLQEMEALLGAEGYTEYLNSFGQGRTYALRVNGRKLSPDGFSRRCGQKLTPVPWIPNGFFYDPSWEAAKDPDYAAGLYYLQEASAMTPASLLPVNPGDKVLDLCAAPGGKATELGVKLNGKGLLLANDISNSRAMALLKNLELFGLPNICVSSEPPEKLADVLPEFFDKILVDAPCSGEGMLRRDPAMAKDWTERGPAYYQPIQRKIMEQAVKLLKPGGCLLYSTCTFSTAENEDTVSYILAHKPDMELVPIPLFPGAADGFGLSGVIRLFPHKIQGEGHFMALLRKKERENQNKHINLNEDVNLNRQRNQDRQRNSNRQRNQDRQRNSNKQRNPNKQGNLNKRENNGQEFHGFSEFLEDLRIPLEPSRIRRLQDRLYYLPEGFPDWAGLRYLRTGLLLGTEKNGRFEPGQALAMSLRAEEFVRSVCFSCDDPRVLRYRKGESIVLEEGEEEINGWCLVCLDGGFPLGWAKGAGKRLKNKYYPGWRC